MGEPSDGDKWVLVVGDWFVDDHWVAGAYRSSTSSRTGKKHLAALQSVKSATESLCGAGRTASVLHHAGIKTYGVGVCAQGDEPALLSMHELPGLREHNPHTLRRWTSANPSAAGAKFLNLGTSDCGTSRAIRFYEKDGDSTVLTQRFDWETEIPCSLPLDELEKLVSDGKTAFRAVVIKDLAKGFIGTDLIQLLVANLAEVPWFISSKSWLPPWFRLLKSDSAAESRGVNLRLLLIPEIAARASLGTRIDADHDSRRTLPSWLVYGQPSKEALELVDRTLRPHFESQESAAVVIVPNSQTVLAFDGNGEGFTHLHRPSRQEIPMPMSSVLLGALTGRMLEHPDANLCSQVKGAADFTHNWRRIEQRRVTDYRKWQPSEEPKDKLKLSRPDDQSVFNWGDSIRQWASAHKSVELGITETGSEPRIELWRAMTELPGYICVVRRKREAVATLANLIQSFARSDHSASESCLLIAPPGAGKSQLVKCLADLEDLTIVSFNITHLYQQQQLLDCFDRIATLQAQVKHSHLLVHFDEINASLEGEEVYRSFLTPVGEGRYVRAEKAFQLQPAFWLFSGTRFDKNSIKAPDFRSRLTHGIIPLCSSEENLDREEACLERVYLGAALLKSFFPEVERVSEEILKLFRELPIDISNRSIADFARSFKDVRHRKVVRENIPWKWIEVNVKSVTREQLERDWGPEGGREILIIDRPV